MVIAEVWVVPIGTNTPSLSSYVAKAVKVLSREKGIKYQVTAMSTLIEGEMDAVMSAIRKMHESLFDKTISRVVTTVTFDDRRDKALTMSYKVESVMKKLG